MSQVTFVGAGSPQGSNTNGNVTPTIPAGVVVGDLLIVVGCISGTARNYNAPAGWSSTTYARDTSGTNGPSLFFAWKAYATGDADPLMTASGTSAPGAGVKATCVAYRNADTTAGPTFGTVTSSGATNGTDVGAISGVAISGLGLGLAIGGWADDYSSPPTATGWTLDDSGEQTSATIGTSFGIFEQNTNNTTSSSVTINGNPTTSTTRVGIQIGMNEAVTNLNDVKLGTGNVNLAVGASPASAAYIGTNKVWP